VLLAGVVAAIDFIAQNPAILIFPAIGVAIWIALKFSGTGTQHTAEEGVGVEVSASELQPNSSRGSASAHRHIATNRNGDEFWIREPQDAQVGGRKLGALLYVGTGLAAIGDHAPEPALIDPGLRIAEHIDGCNVRRLDYWPSYSSASPEARAAYLHWLQTGRQDPGADVGYVFLYLYGLERRALHDALSSATAASEIPQIAKEVARLLEIYRSNRSFERYAEALLDFLLARRLPAKLYASAPAKRVRRELRFSDRLALAQCAADGQALPAAWALVWVTTSGSLGTPARRCPAEFEQLFATRYRERFGDGLVLPKNRTRLKLDYRPASPSFRGAAELSVAPDLPDVSVLTSPLRKLDELADKVCDELSRFSRAVGKDPQAAQSFEGLVELPFALWPEKYRAPIQSVQEVIRRGGKPAAIPFEKLRSWLPRVPDLTRPKLRSLAGALAAAGLGMEPDVRFGGGVPALDSKIVLFADDAATADAEATPAYTAAALTLHLGAAVVAADGVVSESERGLLLAQLEQWLHLSKSESRRLHAHLRLLFAEPPKLSGLKRKIEELTPAAREALGDFLARVAQADDQATPAEIKTLQKIFKLLGLDPEDVFSKVHAAATEPVVVTPATRDRPRYAIPAAPTSEPAPRPGLLLDASKVAALQRDSERVAGILAAVFDQPAAEAVPDPVPESVQPKDDAVARPLGLDAIHAALLETLMSRTHWARTELEELAEDRDLMLDGALEHINEASFDSLDMPMFEYGDPLVLNDDAVRELLGGHHQES
jgi:uncharacterized tellurite resistance protein B-like protein